MKGSQNIKDVKKVKKEIENNGDANHKATDNDVVELKRTLGLVSGSALVIGSMIGSGIFISPKGVLKNTGSVGLSLVVWAIGGIVSLLGGLCFAELGTAFPEAGGEFVYLYRAYGPLQKMFGEMPAFLYTWLMTLLVKPASLAILSLTVADNCILPFFLDCDVNPWGKKCLAAFTILTVTVINCLSIKAATSVQNFFTAAKLLAIAIIIVGGFVKLGQGYTEYLSTGFAGSTSSAGDIATAFYSAMWAYDGWSNVNYVAEELQNPTVNLPRCLMIGIPLVTACYILTNIGYLTVVSPEELLSSNAVAMTFASRVLGPMAWCIPVFVVCSAFGAANCTCFAESRISYAAAKKGHQVNILSFVHVIYMTPSPSIIFNAIFALFMILPADIESLIDLFGFTTWLIYALVFVGLIIMRKTYPNVDRPIKVNYIIPIIVILTSMFFVIAPIVGSPQFEYVYVGIYILVGFIIYFPFVHYKVDLQCSRVVLRYLQLILNVVPPPDSD